MSHWRVMFLALASASLTAHGGNPPGHQASSQILPPTDYKSLRPGLWEITSSEKMATPDMSALMDTSDMDAATRARVEAVLKRQAAERAKEGPDGGVKTSKKATCITKEQIEKAQSSFLGGEGNDPDKCDPVVKQRTSSKIVWEGQCPIKDGPVQGQIALNGSIEILSPTAMTAHFSSSGTMQGQPIANESTMQGRWISADCGNVKPDRD